MTTIRSVLINRLSVRIYHLKKAKLKLLSRSLEDRKLEHQIKRLESIRDRLRKKDSTDSQGISSDLPSTP